MQTVKEAVESLGQSFAQFKSVNDERLQQIERKGSVDPLLEQKLDTLNQQIDQAGERLAKLEAAGQRPVVDITGKDDIEIDEHSVAFANYARKGDETALQAFEGKSLSASSDPDGGYLMPTALGQTIQTALDDNSVMRRISKVITISTDAVELLLDKDQADAGWVGESDDRAETGTPELAKVRIAVHEMYAKPRATQKLLDDASINVENWLAGKVSDKMSSMENQAFIFGDGNGKPRGFLSYAISYDAAAVDWGHLQGFKTGAANSFVPETGGDVLINSVHSLKSGYLSKAKWLMARQTIAEVRKLKDNTGQYLWQPGIDGDYRPKLLGFPIEVCDDMPGVNTEGDNIAIAFGNFNEAYQIVDRQGIRTLRDPYSSKPYVEFYTTKRVGGDVVNFEAIKVINFTE